MIEGIVYVLINDAFDGYLKIGKTSNSEQRLKQLNNTSVPLPFLEINIDANNAKDARMCGHHPYASFRS